MIKYPALAVILMVILLIPKISAADDEFECMIEPYEMVDLSSQVPGILDKVSVERGDFVEEDAELARLKSGVENASVDLARARVEFAERKVVRNEELHKKQLISIHEKDEMETELKVYKLQLLEEEERLKLRTIRSTVKGVVMERMLGPGEYVGENPIFKIARIDPLHVEVIAPVSRYGMIKKGMRAKVIPEEPVGGKYIGRVVIVDQVIDAGSGTFGVRIELPNRNHKLPAGLRCNVSFISK
jgi:RND family efflux transporter MFP subunit